MALKRVFTLEDEMRRRARPAGIGPAPPPFPREKMDDELREFLDWEREHPAGDVSDVRAGLAEAVERWKAARAREVGDMEVEEIIKRQRESDVPVCHRCGWPKSRNPHPEAGKPHVLTEVGTVWECIPCLVLNRHIWARRCWAAEKRVSKMTEGLNYVLKLCGTENSEEYAHALHVDIPQTVSDALEIERTIDSTDGA